MSRIPTLFIGHGSPMNAIETNAYTRWLEMFGKSLARPSAILCVSAHWMTKGTWVTAMESPKTIHDFHGFPDELFAVYYPAPGSPALARRVQELCGSEIGADKSWGLDHGAWSVLRHMFPLAEIPVVQLSLDLAQPASYHFELGRKLRPLREEGVLILASGNLVHNLRRIRWESDAVAFPWALEFEAWLKEKLATKNFAALLDSFADTEAGKLSVPTLDHYVPLHYVLGASLPDESVRFEYEAIQNASISMLSLSFG